MKLFSSHDFVKLNFVREYKKFADFTNSYGTSVYEMVVFGERIDMNKRLFHHLIAFHLRFIYNSSLICLSIWWLSHACVSLTIDKCRSS